MTTAIHWFRRDLRLSDNEALSAAIEGSDAVVPVFVITDTPTRGEERIAARAWLPRSLAALDRALREHGNALVIRTGRAPDVLAGLARECGASRVHCQRDVSDAGCAEEREVRGALSAMGVELKASGGSLLVNPDALSTAQGTPYRVFTPYWRAWERIRPHATPLPAPSRVPALPLPPATAGPLSTPRGGPDIERWWDVGELAARIRLEDFVARLLPGYTATHDTPGVDGTSALSVRLAWGELSPREVAYAAESAGDDIAAPFLRQLAWRDFSHHIMHRYPHTVEAPLDERFLSFPWRYSKRDFAKWAKGRTGYPLVDAGMRQLLATGWMHNRVRMVCASFLAKDLLIPWQTGERFFANRLADYDLALNVFNWQWVAGCGADAAPYFRIFNPTLQARKFDPDGTYIRRWVPELTGIDARWIHEPWKAPASDAQKTGSRGGEYPPPMIEHAAARLRALGALEAMRSVTR